MKRTRTNNGIDKQPATLEQVQKLNRLASELVSRQLLAQQMGFQYQGTRDIYQALGYPQESELTYRYYYNRWDRQDIASAVIDRPVEDCWNAFLGVTDVEDPTDSPLAKAWEDLNKRLKLTRHLMSLDKVMGIGHYAILLLGFNDVKTPQDWARPVSGKSVKLNYVRAVSEEDAKINEFELNTANSRYGQPKFYDVSIGNRKLAHDQQTITLSAKVHHSRVIHVCHGGLDVTVYGKPRLKAIINRLVDLDKIIGGDAEMYWRGARPGYTAATQPEFEMDSGTIGDLIDQLQEYENDLRRFLTTEGVDIKALEQQLADPSSHVEIQIQAIAAQTGIPKRILVGSERGELSSTQDQGQWYKLLKSRAEDFVDVIILEPLVRRLMDFGVLPEVEEVLMIWEDWFAPSKKEKAEVGEIRAKAIKAYAEAFADQYMPYKVALKYLLGLDEDEVEEVLTVIEEQIMEEDTQMEESEQDLPIGDEGQAEQEDEIPDSN